MKLNYYSFELLKIFENELRCSRRISYQPYQAANIRKHIFLEQDKPIDYYAWAIHELFIRESPEPTILQESFIWQLIQTYRIINTVLVSCDESINPIRANLTLLKTKLEAEHYLKQLLTLIDNGQIPTDLVCSGHGVWFQKDGEIDLSNFPPTTAVCVY